MHTLYIIYIILAPAKPVSSGETPATTTPTTTTTQCPAMSVNTTTPATAAAAIPTTVQLSSEFLAPTSTLAVDQLTTELQACSPLKQVPGLFCNKK